MGMNEERGAGMYRDRRLAKAERLREWADKREDKARADLEANKPYEGDIAFATQPGRIIERERVIARSERAFANADKASEFRSRADEIEAQAERAIYSDDEDAVERLEERIEQLVAERERIKAYNASCRKGQRDVSLLDERQQATLASVAKYSGYQLGKNGAAPAYWTANLSGNISRQRKRLAEIKGLADGTMVEFGRLLTVRYQGTCRDCGRVIEKGEQARYFRRAKELACVNDCSKKEEVSA
jgi:hypothetical protein